MATGEEQDLVFLALENLREHIQIQGKWKDHMGGRGYDGEIDLIIKDRNVNFVVEVKRELRSHQLPEIIAQAQKFKPLMVVANHIFPKIKKELRHHQIAYLEANGNIYLEQKGVILWLDNQKPIPTAKGESNRVFTKTGLKVVFYFLQNEDFINQPYRHIAQETKVGLGNINNIMNGLKEMNFLVSLNKNTYKLNNKKELLGRWITAYEERLKPSIKAGTFRFLKQDDFTNWKRLPLKSGKTYWGGEPAGTLLTEYLKPGELTLYTTETRNELIKHYRLVPDHSGNVKVYKKFWHYDEVNGDIAPPLLVYTDLMNTNDRRCIETAQKIYDELLQNKF